MTVYIDVLFAVNFVINFLLLVATAVICRVRVKGRRVLLSASMGALYSVCVFFPQMHILYGSTIKLLAGAVMVIAAFRVRSVRDALKKAAVFYAVTLVFGGATLAIGVFTNAAAATGAIYSNGVLYANLPIGVLLLAVCASYAALYAAEHFLRQSALRARFKRSVAIHCGGRSVEVTALVDTGNSLCDPFDGTPVIVAEYDAIKDILPASARAVIMGCEEYYGEDMRLRMIPFNSLGARGGVLAGFLPDAVSLDGKNMPRCVVCAYEGRLASDGSYRALINPIITEGKDNA